MLYIFTTGLQSRLAQDQTTLDKLSSCKHGTSASMGQLSAERSCTMNNIQVGLKEATKAGHSGIRKRDAQSQDSFQVTAASPKLSPSGSLSSLVIRERKRSLPCFSSVRPGVVFPPPPSDASPPSVFRHSVSSREGRLSYHHVTVSLPEISNDTTPVPNEKEGKTSLSRLQKLGPPELTLESTHSGAPISTAAEQMRSATVAPTPPRSIPLTPKPPSGSPSMPVGRRSMTLLCRNEERVAMEVVSKCHSPLPCGLQQETDKTLTVSSEAMSTAQPDSRVTEASSRHNSAKVVAINGVESQATSVGKPTAVQPASELDVRQELVVTPSDELPATNSGHGTSIEIPSFSHSKSTPPIDICSPPAHRQGQEDAANCSLKDLSLYNSSLSSTNVETASNRPQQGSPVCLSPGPLMLSMVRKDFRQLKAYDSDKSVASDDSRADTPSSCSSLRPMSKL